MARGTRARESYLAAIEEEDFGDLGGDVYVRGFITSYAKFLGLDPDPLVAAFDGGSRDAEPRRRLPRTADVTAERARWPSSARVVVLALLILVLVVTLVVAGLWGFPADASVLAGSAR